MEEKVKEPTQPEKLIAYLTTHEFITHEIAYRKLQIVNITAVISECRKQGHPIIPVTFTSANGKKATKWCKGIRADLSSSTAN